MDNESSWKDLEIKPSEKDKTYEVRTASATKHHTKAIIQTWHESSRIPSDIKLKSDSKQNLTDEELLRSISIKKISENSASPKEPTDKQGEFESLQLVKSLSSLHLSAKKFPLNNSFNDARSLQSFAVSQGKRLRRYKAGLPPSQKILYLQEDLDKSAANGFRAKSNAGARVKAAVLTALEPNGQASADKDDGNEIICTASPGRSYNSARMSMTSERSATQSPVHKDSNFISYTVSNGADLEYQLDGSEFKRQSSDDIPAVNASELMGGDGGAAAASANPSVFSKSAASQHIIHQYENIVRSPNSRGKLSPVSPPVNHISGSRSPQPNQKRNSPKRTRPVPIPAKRSIKVVENGSRRALLCQLRLTTDALNEERADAPYSPSGRRSANAYQLLRNDSSFGMLAASKNYVGLQGDFAQVQMAATAAHAGASAKLIHQSIALGSVHAKQSLMTSSFASLGSATEKDNNNNNNNVNTSSSSNRPTSSASDEYADETPPRALSPPGGGSPSAHAPDKNEDMAGDGASVSTNPALALDSSKFDASGRLDSSRLGSSRVNSVRLDSTRIDSGRSSPAMQMRAQLGMEAPESISVDGAAAGTGVGASILGVGGGARSNVHSTSASPPLERLASMSDKDSEMSSQRGSSSGEDGGDVPGAFGKRSRGKRYSMTDWQIQICMHSLAQIITKLFLS